MDKPSVTRAAPPSTKAIVADEGFCAQVAALLLCDRGPIRRFHRRASRRSTRDGPVGTLPRGRRGLRHRRGAHHLGQEAGEGAWSGRPRRPQECDDEAERLAVALARMWTEQPESLAEAIRALEQSRSQNGRS
jgi:hypothetical protein